MWRKTISLYMRERENFLWEKEIGCVKLKSWNRFRRITNKVTRWHTGARGRNTGLWDRHDVKGRAGPCHCIAGTRQKPVWVMGFGLTGLVIFMRVIQTWHLKCHDQSWNIRDTFTSPMRIVDVAASRFEHTIFDNTINTRFIQDRR